MSVAIGKVVGKILTIRADGPDAGREPDVVGSTASKPVFEPLLGSFASPELRALVTAEKYECKVGADGTLQDPQGGEGVWMIAGDYKVSGVPNVTEITVLPTHTDEHPLDLFDAANYVIPPRTPVQTVLLPAGASNGQILGWLNGPAWVPAAGGGPHRHAIADVDGLEDELAGKAPAGDYLTAEDLPVIPEPPDLSGYVRTEDLPAPPDLSPYLTAEDLPAAPDLSPYLTAEDLPAPPDLSPYLTAEDLPGPPDLSGYVRTEDLPEPPDLSPYLTAEDLPGPAFWSGTQAQYDALPTPRPAIPHFILEG